MDPLTHALAGATIAWAATAPRIGRRALVIGAAAALLPDADVLIRSSADPLLAIEHHRGFTHSLLFVPAGAAIAASPFSLKLDRTQRTAAFLAAVLACLSHALLDSATTYGTRLFWPFSRYRVGLDIISIIDPLFTLVMLTGVIAAMRARRRLVTAALSIATIWLVLGFVQRERATAAQNRLALSRGEAVTRAAVFPTLGNTIVWRSIYETSGTLRIDRIRAPWLGAASHAPGTTVPHLTSASLPNDERMHRDFARFAWFSDGWTARAPNDPTFIGDARYSLRTDGYDPVWGIRFTPAATEWVNRTTQREVGMAKLWAEISGRDPAFTPIQ